jgi:hypothetical protein
VLLEKIGTARLRNGSQLNQKSLRAALRAGLKSLANKSPKPT